MQNPDLSRPARRAVLSRRPRASTALFFAAVQVAAAPGGASGQAPLPLTESPPGGGLFSAVVEDTVGGVGFNDGARYTFNAEGGDRATVVVNADTGSLPRLRVLDASGAILANVSSSTPRVAAQSVHLAAPGNYEVIFWSDRDAPSFQLRLDLGRGLALEVEGNDSPLEANRLETAASAGGGAFSARAAGALEFSDDHFALGRLAPGNVVAVGLGLPADSTLVPDDVTFSLLRDGGFAPVATGSGGLNFTVAEAGDYTLRTGVGGLHGRALVFAGEDDRVDLPAAVADGLADFTLEFWARPEPGFFGRGIVSGAGGRSTDELLVFTSASTSVQLYLAGTAVTWSVPNLSTGQWRHFAFLRDAGAGTAELFLDGVSMGVLGARSEALSVQSLLLGQDQDSVGGGFQSSQAYVGDLDELRVWSALRTAEEIRAARGAPLAGDEAGLVAYYDANGSSPTALADRTAAGHDGTLVGVERGGDPAEDAFSPTRQGALARYLTTVTVTDGTAPAATSGVPLGRFGASGGAPLDAVNPGDLIGFRGQVGLEVTFLVTGSNQGTIYGTDFYTDDSPPATAAVHAGLLAVGQTGFVTAQILGDRDSFAASERNGVTSLGWAPTWPAYALSAATPDGASGWTGLFHRLRVTFSEDLEASTVRDPAGFELRGAGPDGVFDSADDHLYPLTNTDYLGGTEAILDIGGDPLQEGAHRFRALPALLDRAGNPLGSVFETTFELAAREPFALEGRENGTFETATSVGTLTAAADGSLSAAGSVPTGVNPWDVEVADIDGDGRGDAAVLLREGNALELYFGNGDMTFSDPVVLPGGSSLWDLERFDLDGDTDVDFAAVANNDDTLWVFRNDGGRAFTALGPLPVGDQPRKLVAGDFNRDGDADLAVTNWGSQNVTLHLGDGAGGFSTEILLGELSPRVRPYGIAAGDLNGDGAPDLGFTDADSDRVGVLLNDGTGGFGDPAFYPVQGTDHPVLVLADFDGDGAADLLATPTSSSAFSVLPGGGDGTFEAEVVVDLSNHRSQYHAAAADLNGDGRPDVLIGRSNEFEYLINRGSPAGGIAFGPPVEPISGRQFYGVAAGAIDADGIADLVAVDFGNHQLFGYRGDAEIAASVDGVDGRARHFYGRGALRDAPDVDWFAFSARPGEQVNIAVESALPATSAGLVHQLYDPQGRFLAQVPSASDGRGHLPPYTIEQEGRYRVRVSRNWNFFGEYTFRVTLVEAPLQFETEDNNNTGQADVPVLNLGAGELTGLVHGYFEGDADADYTALGNLAEGTTVNLAANPLEASPAEVTIELLKSDGTVVATAAPGAGPLVFALGAGDDDAYTARLTTAEGASGLRSQYLLEITLTDAVAPSVTGDTLPGEGTTSNLIWTGFSLDFSEDLVAAGVNDPASFELRSAGVDGVLDNGDDALYTVQSTGYVSGLGANFFLPDGPLQPGLYRFTATGALTDLLGNPLAAPYVRNFTIEGVPGYVLEGRDNGERTTADSLGSGPPGGFDGSFALSGTRPVAVQPWDVELADFDRDGTLDAAVLTRSSASLEIHLGNGDGTFADAVSYPAGGELWDLVPFDLDGDGDTDLAASLRPGDAVRVFRNGGDGTFAPLAPVAVGDDPRALVAADFNGDGDPDLAVSNFGTGGGGRTVSLLLGDGDGAFAHAFLFDDLTPRLRPFGIAAADFDDDGDIDLAVGDIDGDAVWVALNDGSGAFAAPVNIGPGGGNPSTLAVGDAGGDGVPDIFAMGESDTGVRLFEGSGGAAFEPPAFIPLSGHQSQYHLRAPDLDGDGYADLVVPRSGGLEVLINRGPAGSPGAGRYGTPDRTFTNLSHYGAAAGDVDGDGRVDLVAAFWNGPELRVLAGNARLALPADGVLGGVHHVLGRGRLLDAADIDWFTFSGRAGQSVQVASANPGDPSGSGLVFQIYDNAGTFLVQGSGDSRGRGESLPIVLPRDGRYAVRFSRNWNYFGEYRFRVTLADPPFQIESEANDNTGQADAPVFALVPGRREARVLGYVPADDPNGDYFLLGNLAEGTTARMELTPLGDSTLVPTLEILKDGAPVAQGGAGETTLEHAVTAGEGGTYHARVTGDPASLGLLAHYGLDLTLTDAVPPAITGDDLPAEGGSVDFDDARFRLSFSEDLTPDTVLDPGNYDLREAGADGAFDTADDDPYAVAPRPYASGAFADYVIGDGPLQPGSYRFTAGTGLTDLLGNPLPAPYVRTFAVTALPGFMPEGRSNGSIATAGAAVPGVPGAFDGSFSLGADRPTGDRPWDVELGDLDGDGDLDALVVTLNADTFEIHLGNGDGTFGDPATHPAPSDPWDALLFDLDGDGDLDAAAAARGSDRVELLRNRGDGTFEALAPAPTGDQPIKLAAADFNGDGRADLAVANFGSNTNTGLSVSLLLGDGNGGFTESPRLGTDLVPRFQPFALAAADFDGDGDADIAAGDYDTAQVAVFLGGGDGTFGAPALYPVANNRNAAIAVADFNGDRRPDLAVLPDSGGTVSILAGRGDGTFETHTQWTLGANRTNYHLRAADLNADGWPDLLAGRSSRLTYRLNRPGAQLDFSAPVEVSEPDTAYAVAAGDLDGDGRNDLVAASENFDRLYSFLGNGGLALVPDAAVAGVNHVFGRGSLVDRDDFDFWTFSLRDGDRVLFASDVPGNPGGSGLAYQLYNMEGTFLGSFNAGSPGYGQSAPVVIDQPGRHFIRVSRNWDHLGEYRFRLTAVRPPVQLESENNNATSGADPLEFALGAGVRQAEVVGALITADPADHFDLGGLAPGTGINLSLIPFGRSPLQPVLALLRADGTPVAEGAPGEAELGHVVAAGEDGRFFARVQAGAGTDGLESEYHLEITLSPAGPPAVTGTDLPPAGSTSFGLIDRFSVGFNEELVPATVEDAASYALRSAGPDGLFGTPDDGLLPLVPGAYSGGLATSVVIGTGPLAPGAYRLTVEGLQNTFGAVLPAPFEHPFNVGQVNGFTTEAAGNATEEGASPVELVDPAPGFRSGGGRGALQAGTSVDYWRFEAAAGEWLTFDAELVGTNNGLSYQLTAPGGGAVFSKTLSRNRHGETGPFELAEDGTYRIRVTRSHGDTTEYRFRVSLVAPPRVAESESNNALVDGDPLPLADAGGDIFSGGAAGVVHDDADLDYFCLGEVASGRSVFLTVGQPGHSPLVPVVSLYNAAGEVLPEVSGQAGDGSAEVAVVTGGIHYALVRGLAGSTGLMSEYLLDVQTVPTDSIDAPNLRVTEITPPAGAGLQSGDPIGFSFRVTNAGSQATAAVTWFDRAVLSANPVFGDGDDIELGLFPRTGPLAAGASYDVDGAATVPDGVSGDFFVLVRTDFTDVVEEVFLEGDNTASSDTAFTVALKDYPDLVVENLTVEGPRAGDRYDITWATANRGAAAAPAGFTVRLTVINTTSGQVVLDAPGAAPDPLAVDGILPGAGEVATDVPGVYLVVVTADAGGVVFEFGPDGHLSAEQNSAQTTFTIFQFYPVAVAASPPEGGTVSGGGSFVEGREVTMSAEADTAVLPYRFVNWTEGGRFVSAQPDYTFVADRPRDLTAVFDLPAFQVTAAADPPEGGTVSGAGTYPFGSAVDLRANPNPGYLFERWEEGGANAGTDPLLRLTIDRARGFVARFAEAVPEHVVTTATAPAGLAALPGAGTYANGESADLSAPPVVVQGDSEFLFRRWLLNGVFFGPEAGFTKRFSTLDPADMTFTAEYRERSLKPVVASVSASRPAPFPAGAGIVFTLTFDRPMDTSIAPVLELVSANAAQVPTVPAGGAWTGESTFVTAAFTTGAGNGGSYQLRASAAADTAGRVMDAADVFGFVVDVEPPAHPVVARTGSDATSVTLGWPAYTAPVDLGAFRVFLETATFDSVAGLEAHSGTGPGAREFRLRDLQPDVPYFAAVAAVDVAGNLDPSVTALPVTLQSDLPPRVDFVLTAPAPRRAALDWSGYDASGLVGFAGFHVFWEGADFASVDGLAPRMTLGPGERSAVVDSLDRSAATHFAVVGFNRLGQYDLLVQTRAWRDPLAGDLEGDLTVGGPGTVVDVFAPLNVAGGATLTVLPGTTLRFAAGAGLTVESGVLDARGTALDPVHFTAATEAPGGRPAVGDWEGITLRDPARASLLDHVWVRYGRGLRSEGAAPEIGAFRAVRNTGAGLAFSGPAPADALRGLFLAFNHTGLENTGAGAVVAAGSVLKNNAEFNADRAGAGPLDVAASWWGSADPAAISGGLGGGAVAGDPLGGEPVLASAATTASGGATTGSRTIGLRLASPNAVAYRLSEDSLFPGVPFVDIFEPGEVDLFFPQSFEAGFFLSPGGGQKTVFAQFQSVTGDLGDPVPVMVEFITEGPAITAFSLAEGQVIGRPVTVTAAATAVLGLAGLEFFADGERLAVAAASPLTFRWDVRGLGAGPRRVRLVARDSAGNFAARELNVRVDPAPPPAPVIASPAAGAVLPVSPAAVAGTAEPGAALRLTRNGFAGGTTTAAGDGTFSFPAVALVEGTNALRVIASDGLGSTTSAPVTVSLDSGAPEPVNLGQLIYDLDRGLIVAWSFLPGSGERASRFQVFWHGAPFANPAQASGNSAVFTGITYTLPASVPDGPLHVGVVGYDAAGNAAPLSNLQSIVLDRTRPSFTVGYDRAMPVGPGDLGIVLTASEPLGATPVLTVRPAGLGTPIAVPLTKSSGTTYEGVYPVNSLSARSGTAVLRVTGADLSGNRFSGAPLGPSLVFDVTKPSGAITLDRPAPVQTRVDVTVSFSLELSEAARPGTEPRLRFAPPIGSPVEIALAGAGASWTGSLALSPAMGRGEGLFLLEAEDAVGNAGTVITAGGALEIYNTDLPDPPGIPVNLAAATLAGGGVRVTWDAVPGAQTYRVFREPGGAGGTPAVQVADGLAGPVFNDVPGADGVYRYAVTALRLGAESAPSGILPALADSTPPGPPRDVEVRLLDRGVSVNFAAPLAGEVPSRYHVYRGETLVRTLTAPREVVDQPPRGVFDYRVASADPYGNEASSDPVTIELLVGAVADLQALVRPGFPLSLTWVSGDATATGYNVYRNGVKQNTAPLAQHFYQDTLANLGTVSYAVTALNAAGDESARRAVEVNRLDWGLGVNLDAAGLPRPALARYFDRYTLDLRNRGAAPLVLESAAVNRTMEGGAVTAFEEALGAEIPAGGALRRDLVAPGPPVALEEQTVRVTLMAAAEPGAGGVRYEQVFLPGLGFEPAGPVTLSVAAPPVAGGRSSLRVEVANPGFAAADLILTRAGGEQPGDVVASVLDARGEEVSRLAFNGIGVPGLAFTPDGRGFLRVPAGGRAGFTVDEILVPAALGEEGAARFRVVIDPLYHDLAGPSQRRSGPVRGSLRASVVETPYFAAASIEGSDFANDQTITITGTAVDRASGGPATSVPLRVGFSTGGFTWFEEVEADAGGAFSLAYEPPFGFAGVVNIWAAHPEVFDVLDQVEVTFHRLFVSPVRGDVRMSKNDTLEITLRLINPGTAPLSDVSLDARFFRMVGEDEVPVETITAAIKPGDPGIVEAGATRNLAVVLSSAEDAPDDALGELTVSTAEGARGVFSATVALLPAVPVLDVERPAAGFVDVSLDRDGLLSRQVIIVNRGLRPLEGVRFIPPAAVPWFQVNLPGAEAGAVDLPDIPVGGTLRFSAVFTPPADVPQGDYEDVVTITGDNAMADFELNLFARVTSNRTGTAQFDVINVLGQAVPAAAVQLRNLVNGEEFGPLRTDVEGGLTVPDLREGQWSWKVSAPGHATAAGVVEVVPEQVNEVAVELQKSLVTVTFNVVPVPFTDRYEIRIEQTFETRVPAPVLVLDPPSYSFKNAAFGFDTTVFFELKNEGLISVFDGTIEGVEISVGSLVPLVQIFPELGAQESIRIPARVRLFDPADPGDGGPGGANPIRDPARRSAFTNRFPCDPGGAADYEAGKEALMRMAARADAISPLSFKRTELLRQGFVALENYDDVLGKLPGPFKYAEAINWVVRIVSCFGSAGGGGGSSGGGRPRGGPVERFVPRAGGCFAPGTPVLLADGTLRPIEEVALGDRLRAGPNPGQVATVERVFERRSDRLFDLALEPLQGGADPFRLRGTAEHRVWLDDRGWDAIANLEAGDWLQGTRGEVWVLKAIQPVAGTHTVHTFQLAGDGAFYAGGVLVQDLCGGLFLPGGKVGGAPPGAPDEGAPPAKRAVAAGEAPISDREVER